MTMTWEHVIKELQGFEPRAGSRAIECAVEYALMAQHTGMAGPRVWAYDHPGEWVKFTFGQDGAEGTMRFGWWGRMECSKGGLYEGAPSRDSRTRRTRVYVAGPYTLPDPVINTRQAIKMGEILLDWGYAPFVPHLNLLWDFLTPKPHDTWLELDHAWLDVCDVLLRLPGTSSGADREVAWAREMGIPVFMTCADLRHGFDTFVQEPVGKDLDAVVTNA